MRIYLHIGPEQVGTDRMQQVLSDKREQLLGKGVLFARSPGGKNHTRLFMAVKYRSCASASIVSSGCANR